MHNEPPDRSVLPAAALGGAFVGALCAVGLTTYAGARVEAPQVLRLLFAGWVCAPFAALSAARAMSESWRPSMQAALHVTTLLTAAISSLAYGYFAFGTARPPTAAFVLVAPASWLFAAAALGAAALSIRK
jgi:hypothetical protein